MPQDWQLRPGGKDDVRAMYMLDLVCFDEPFRFTLPAMRKFVCQPGAIVQVAESHGTLVGFIVVHQVRKRTGYIVTLDVATAFRRGGVATALVEAAQRQVSADAGVAIMLHVSTANPAAIAFYERRGYQRLEICLDFYSAGYDALIYRKELNEGAVG